MNLFHLASIVIIALKKFNRLKCTEKSWWQMVEEKKKIQSDKTRGYQIESVYNLLDRT